MEITYPKGITNEKWHPSKKGKVINMLRSPGLPLTVSVPLSKFKIHVPEDLSLCEITRSAIPDPN